LFRTRERLTASLVELDNAWQTAGAHLHAVGRARVRAREAAALLASATSSEWTSTSKLPMS